MIRFFDLKCELFGKAKLAKDITVEDLDQDDIAALESGWLQAAGRDQSGRQVFVHLGDVPIADLPRNIMSVIRSQYFVLMRALRSEETQIRGSVSIWYGLGKYKRPGNSSEYRALMNYGRAIPQKKAATHALVDDLYQYTFLEFSMKVIKANLKTRFRVHFGSHLECQYQLTTFGISSSTLPIDAQGRLEVARHIDWIRSCAIEDNVTYCPSVISSSALHSVAKPSPNDVLFQSGKTVNHEGNKRLRAIVADYIQAYASAGNDEVKRELVTTVIGKIHANGGRFLKRAGNSTTTWEEVPPDELRKKVMQTFRNHRRLASGSKPSVIGSIDGVLIAGDPLPNDVVFGRLAQKNAGTELLYRLIKENFEEYESLNRGEKMKLVEFMMQTIRDRGGRFLQSNTETYGWIEVPHDDARERISKYFRNHRRQSSKKS